VYALSSSSTVDRRRPSEAVGAGPHVIISPGARAERRRRTRARANTDARAERGESSGEAPPPASTARASAAEKAARSSVGHARGNRAATRRHPGAPRVYRRPRSPSDDPHTRRGRIDPFRDIGSPVIVGAPRARAFGFPHDPASPAPAVTPRRHAAARADPQTLIVGCSLPNRSAKMNTLGEGSRELADDMSSDSLGWIRARPRSPSRSSIGLAE
jgi:hypothetical protein